MKKNISKNETIIKGSWILSGNKMIEDEVTKRIHQLIEHHLKKVSASKDGWNILYLDQSDNRYWELTYPASGEHGGGAPQLSYLTHDLAIEKYGLKNKGLI